MAENLVDQAYGHIRARLSRGDWAPGHAPSESRPRRGARDQLHPGARSVAAARQRAASSTTTAGRRRLRSCAGPARARGALRAAPRRRALRGAPRGTKRDRRTSSTTSTHATRVCAAHRRRARCAGRRCQRPRAPSSTRGSTSRSVSTVRSSTPRATAGCPRVGSDLSFVVAAPSDPQRGATGPRDGGRRRRDVALAQRAHGVPPRAARGRGRRVDGPPDRTRSRDGPGPLRSSRQRVIPSPTL
jgi:hypothetical protein